jgi:hypothetical protein
LARGFQKNEKNSRSLPWWIAKLGEAAMKSWEYAPNIATCHFQYCLSQSEPGLLFYFAKLSVQRSNNL